MLIALAVGVSAGRQLARGDTLVSHVVVVYMLVSHHAVGGSPRSDRQAVVLVR